MIYGLWGIITAAFAVPAGIYLLLPPKQKKAGQWVDAADVSQLPPNVPEEIVFRRNRVDGWKITSEKSTAWVVKTSGNGVVAFAPQCTHLGCAYHWDEEHKYFLCPCHTSTFDLQGRVLGGPAPRPLDRYETKIEGSRLLLGSIDKAKSV
jgi:menaquinol-cytochrome c reductase iron-sulfur subunit